MPMRLSVPHKCGRFGLLRWRRGEAEKSMQLRDDGCALPDGAADAFDGARAHIADSEDPSRTRLVLRSFVDLAA